MTVRCRRSAEASAVFGCAAATGAGGAASGVAARAAIASRSFLRWPNDATPMSLRSPFVSRLSTSPSISLARKISAYWLRPISRSQLSMSKFSPLGRRQRQSLKRFGPLAPAFMPRFSAARRTPTEAYSNGHATPRDLHELELPDFHRAKRRSVGPLLPLREKGAGGSPPDEGFAAGKRVVSTRLSAAALRGRYT